MRAVELANQVREGSEGSQEELLKEELELSMELLVKRGVSPTAAKELVFSKLGQRKTMKSYLLLQDIEDNIIRTSPFVRARKLLAKEI
jgi:hypothetical protein